MTRVHRIAEWLVRFEIPLLVVIYLYFVISDNVPLVAFGLIALIWLARWWTNGKIFSTTPFDLPIIILLVMLPISLWVTIDMRASVAKVNGILLGVIFFYAVINQIATRCDLAWAMFWLVIVCIAIALAGLIGTDWAQGKIVSATFIYDQLPRFIQGIPRSIAGGFNRNGVGGTLTLTIPLLAAIASEKLKVKSQKSVHCLLLTGLALALSLITLALTQSRGGILGTTIGLLAVAIWRDRRFAWLIILGGVGVLALIILGYANSLIDFVLRMDAKSGTLASRMEVWQRGVMMVRDFPLTGIGIGTYNAVAHLMYPFFISAPDEIVAHAHNNFLEIAVDLGIPGFVAFIGLLVSWLVHVVRAYRVSNDGIVRAILAGIAFGMLAHQVFGLTDAFILGTKPGVLMWIYFALVVVVWQKQREWREAKSE
jgi:putative inorganic carbon (HCO3(-)) transporter